jgi:peptide/nickel transport system permease protein
LRTRELDGAEAFSGDPGILGTESQQRRWRASNSLLWIVSRRLLIGALVLFFVSALSFVLVSLTPGDAARAILGPYAPPATYVQLRHSLGLDLPLYEQYWRWLTHAAHGDLGRSLVTSEKTTDVINKRLPVTISLLLVSSIVISLLGVGIGIFSAVRGGRVGRSVDGFAIAGFALPSFWVGALLISFFAVRLRWFPATGYTPLSQSPVDWIRSLTLPVLALTLGSVAAIAKLTREAMLDALASEYVRMAKASGISPRSIIFRHALKNASMRIVTMTGLLVVGLLSGTIFVESVFALPGLGGMAVTSSMQHDLPVIQGIVIYFTVIVVVVNLLVDLTYTFLNPKVRVR